MCVWIGKNTAVCCLTARKSPRNSSLPLGLAIYILRKMPRKPDESSVECYGHGFLIAARPPRGIEHYGNWVCRPGPTTSQEEMWHGLHLVISVYSVWDVTWWTALVISSDLCSVWQFHIFYIAMTGSSLLSSCSVFLPKLPRDHVCTAGLEPLQSNHWSKILTHILPLAL